MRTSHKECNLSLLNKQNYSEVQRSQIVCQCTDRYAVHYTDYTVYKQVRSEVLKERIQTVAAAVSSFIESPTHRPHVRWPSIWFFLTPSRSSHSQFAYASVHWIYWSWISSKPRFLQCIKQLTTRDNLSSLRGIVPACLTNFRAKVVWSTSAQRSAWRRVKLLNYSFAPWEWGCWENISIKATPKIHLL